MNDRENAHNEPSSFRQPSIVARLRETIHELEEWLASEVDYSSNETLADSFEKYLIEHLDLLHYRQHELLRSIRQLRDNVMISLIKLDDHPARWHGIVRPKDRCFPGYEGGMIPDLSILYNYLRDVLKDLTQGEDHKRESVTIKDLFKYAKDHCIRKNDNASKTDSTRDLPSVRTVQRFLTNPKNSDHHILFKGRRARGKSFRFHYSKTRELLRSAQTDAGKLGTLLPKWEEFSATMRGDE